MYILGKFHSSQALKTVSVLREWDRSKAKICVIDNEGFEYLDILRRNGYFIQYQRDITDIRHVSEYDIVLCDIHGVGRELNPNYEGAFVIKEIKKMYPTKVVIAYSGKTFDASYNDYFKIADYVFKKDISSEQWIDKLDLAIRAAVDPFYQWNQIRAYLTEKEVQTDDILRIEDNYVRTILEKKKDFPNQKVSKAIGSDVKAVLVGVAGNLVFRLLFG